MKQYKINVIIFFSVFIFFNCNTEKTDGVNTKSSDNNNDSLSVQLNKNIILSAELIVDVQNLSNTKKLTTNEEKQLSEIISFKNEVDSTINKNAKTENDLLFTLNDKLKNNIINLKNLKILAQNRTSKDLLKQEIKDKIQYLINNFTLLIESKHKFIDDDKTQFDELEQYIANEVDKINLEASIELEDLKKINEVIDQKTQVLKTLKEKFETILKEKQKIHLYNFLQEVKLFLEQNENNLTNEEKSSLTKLSNLLTKNVDDITLEEIRNRYNEYLKIKIIINKRINKFVKPEIKSESISELNKLAQKVKEFKADPDNFKVNNQKIGKYKIEFLKDILKDKSDQEMDKAFSKMQMEIFTSNELEYAWYKNFHNPNTLLETINSKKYIRIYEDGFKYKNSPEDNDKEANISSIFAKPTVYGDFGDVWAQEEAVDLFSATILGKDFYPTIKKPLQKNQVALLKNVPQFAEIDAKQVYDVKSNNSLKTHELRIKKCNEIKKILTHPKNIDFIAYDGPVRPTKYNKAEIEHLFFKYYLVMSSLVLKYSNYKTIYHEQGNFTLGAYQGNPLIVYSMQILVRAALEDYLDANTKKLVINNFLLESQNVHKYNKAEEIVLQAIKYFIDEKLNPSLNDIWSKIIELFLENGLNIDPQVNL